MAGRRVVRALVLTAILLGGGLAGAVAALDAPPAETGTDPEAADRWTATGPPVGPPEIDTTTTRIRVHANGSATWTVEIRTRLTNDTDRQDYERFQQGFRADTERYLGPFRERMTALVAKAGNVTGREMTARAFTASTRIQETPRRWGIVEYSFHWEAFAASADGALAVGDVFESGYYLADGDSLVVETPEGYRIADPRPAPERQDAGSVRWVGPLDFADRRPAVRLVEGQPTTTTGDETSQNGGGTTGGDGDSSESGGGGILPLVGGAVLLVLAGGSYVVLSRREPTGSDAGTADAADQSDDGGSDDDQADGDDEEDDGGAADAPAELVTNEEQVVALLESNDGRMRQADIADRLDWSAPKTSRVLSDMADEGSIEKLRLGNENIIDLPDEE